MTLIKLQAHAVADVQAENESLELRLGEQALELMQCRTQIRNLLCDLEVSRSGQALLEEKLEIIKSVIDE